MQEPVIISQEVQSEHKSSIFSLLSTVKDIKF